MADFDQPCHESLKSVILTSIEYRASDRPLCCATRVSGQRSQGRQAASLSNNERACVYVYMCRCAGVSRRRQQAAAGSATLAEWASRQNVHQQQNRCDADYHTGCCRFRVAPKLITASPAEERTSVRAIDNMFAVVCAASRYIQFFPNCTAIQSAVQWCSPRCRSSVLVLASQLSCMSPLG